MKQKSIARMDDYDSDSRPQLKRRRTDSNDEVDTAAPKASPSETTVPIKKVQILDKWTKFEISVIRLSKEYFLLAHERTGAYLFPTYACDGRYACDEHIPFSSIIFDANKSNGNEYKGSESSFTDTWVGIFTALTMSNTARHLPDSFNIEEYREAYVESCELKKKH